MGAGTLIVCGRKVTTPEDATFRQGKAVVEGWYKPFSYSPEYVMYVEGVPTGEVYKVAMEERWISRLYPHKGKAYDTLDEAMLFLEAIAALTQ